MPNDMQGAIVNPPKPEALYAKLEDRILARDQKGASEVYYELVRQRPAAARDAARGRAHPRALHARALSRAHRRRLRQLRQQRPLPAERPRRAAACRRCCRSDCAGLPMAQTIWYIPTGLDIWNQKIAKAPGHYARGLARCRRARRRRRSCTGPTSSR